MSPVVKGEDLGGYARRKPLRNQVDEINLKCMCLFVRLILEKNQRICHL